MLWGGWRHLACTSSATLPAWHFRSISAARAAGCFELPHVPAVLEPTWTKKTETASRLRNRLESALDRATTRGYRTGLNPARWKGHLDTVLPAAGSVANAGHHSALHVGGIWAFWQTLRSQAGISALALESAILIAARSGEVRGAPWTEINLDAATWTVPGERMKAGEEHRVPLSDAALAILNALPHADRKALAFASPRGGMLSDMSLTAGSRPNASCKSTALKS